MLDLDDLMAEATAHKAGKLVKKAEKQADGTFDLDDLLAEAQELKSTTTRVKGAKKALKNSLLNRKEREDLQGYVDAWESSTNWIDEAYVAMFTTHECKNCECLHSVFQGFFIQQRSKTDKTAVRWIPAKSGQSGDLPRARKEIVVYAERCWECIESSWLKESNGTFAVEPDFSDRIAGDESILPSERDALIAQLKAEHAERVENAHPDRAGIHEDDEDFEDEGDDENEDGDALDDDSNDSDASDSDEIDDSDDYSTDDTDSDSDWQNSEALF